MPSFKMSMSTKNETKAKYQHAGKELCKYAERGSSLQKKQVCFFGATPKQHQITLTNHLHLLQRTNFRVTRLSDFEQDNVISFDTVC